MIDACSIEYLAIVRRYMAPITESEFKLFNMDV